LESIGGTIGYKEQAVTKEALGTRQTASEAAGKPMKQCKEAVAQEHDSSGKGKHGSAEVDDIFGFAADKLEIVGDIVAPSVPAEEWECLKDDGDLMTDFGGVEFPAALAPLLRRVLKLVEESGGEGLPKPEQAYRPPKMSELRVAWAAGGEGKDKATGVIVRILPRKSGFLVVVRGNRRFRFSDHEQPIDQLREALTEPALKARKTRRPNPEKEFGDGVALPGGQFESNRSKH
jgi:hypothetical protein